MFDWDHDQLREAIQAAQAARGHGNHPFGALLADGDGKMLLIAENSVLTDRDCTAHAETNLVRLACRQYDPDFLATCTLYASTEPCPMCAGAIFWANIRRVVFGLSSKRMYGMTGGDSDESFGCTCADVFSWGKKDVVVIGPLLEEEALAVHRGFWK